MSLIEALDEEVYAHLPKEQFDALQQDETIDLLDNFGFVEFNKNVATNEAPTAESILEGIKSFRAEMKDSLLHGKIHIPEIPELSERELDYLADLSDLEGGFQLADFEIDQVKSDPILCRILNFRLQIFSALPKDVRVGADFNEQTIAALQNLGSWIGIDDQRVLINLTDNFSDLVEKACKNEDFGDTGFRNLLFFKYEGKERVQTDYQWFESYLWRVPEVDLSYYKTKIFEKNTLPKPMREHMDGIAANPVAKFFVRLIQVKLWLVGSYNQELDGDMGGFSISAIQDLYEMVQQTEGDKYDDFVKPDRVIYKLKKGYWALNYKYLLLDGMTKIDWNDEPLEETMSLSEPINQLLDSAQTEEDKTAILTALNESMTTQTEEDAQGSRKKKKYRKGRGFFRNVTNFFKKVGKWVVNKISDLIAAVKNFFKWVKNGMTYLIREIKEAFSKIKMALSFFFGKRILNTTNPDGTAGITTDFDSDFDAVNFISGDVGLNTFNMHETKGINITEAMQSTFKILGVALPLMIQIAAGPLGWLKAGISLVKLLFKEKFDQKFNLLGMF